MMGMTQDERGKGLGHDPFVETPEEYEERALKPPVDPETLRFGDPNRPPDPQDSTLAPSPLTGEPPDEDIPGPGGAEGLPA
jgi:hypothetical protein